MSEKAMAMEYQRFSGKPDLEELLDALRVDLAGLMDHYHPRPDTSDYVCSFCLQRASVNYAEIPHDEDCLGKLLHKALWDRWEAQQKVAVDDHS